jgi:Xaa-Pro aminopeptidase
MPEAPSRGFSLSEFERRTQRVQELMTDLQIDALFLCSEPEVRYFSGFQSQFWESPTRPWFLIVPLEGCPIAVIPEIGASAMEATWIDDIRTWPAPQPDDDGISLLKQVFAELPRRHGRVGAPLGHETLMRMPIADFQKLQGSVEFVDATSVLRTLRNVKSSGEIAKIRYICQVASDAFEALPQSLKTGQSEKDNCRRMAVDLLQRGADSVPYLIAGSGPGGYDSIIMGPTDRIIEEGDVLIIDTGATYDGYFCDFDRNFAFGEPSKAAKLAYDIVFQATDAGFQAARPGATTTDLWAAMAAVLRAGGSMGNDVGRMGHFLGMQLTEGPSITPTDMTRLEPGMVLTLEPGMTTATGKQMVHEENIVITEHGAEYLSRRAPPGMPVIG